MTERRIDMPEYNAWLQMKQRCNNSRCKRYKYYGARGIKVCDRWLDFDNFIADMGRRPGKGYSIDRIDNDGNYEPDNCRWATQTQQILNRRDIRNSTSHKGIRKKHNCYQARITVDYKEIYLGNFKTLAEAISARKEAEIKYARA